MSDVRADSEGGCNRFRDFEGLGTDKLRRVSREMCTEKRMAEVELCIDEADVEKCLMIDEGVMAQANDTEVVRRSKYSNKVL